MVEAKFTEGRLVLKGCFPHYRRPLAEIIELRKIIHRQLSDQKINLPFPEKKKIQLSIIAHRHELKSDLSNVVQGICQALDGNTLGKEFAILESDSQIVLIRAQWSNA